MGLRVGKNVAINVSGAMLPAAAGLVAAPIFLSNLGAGRLGIFTIALGVIGFSGLFDLGLGRALTRTVASTTGAGLPAIDVYRLVRRTIPIIAFIGVLWGSALVLASGLISNHVFHIPDDLAVETRAGIIWLGLAIPVVVITACLAGVLEGLQLFGRANMIRIPAGVLGFLAPAAGSYVTADIGHVIGLLVLVRLIALLVWAREVRRALVKSADAQQDTQGTIPSREMWKFTGWLTVSNLIGPIMVHADRFYLASIFPPASIAYYTVPLDAAFRSTALPLMAMNAVLPALAHSGAESTQATRLLRSAAPLMLLLWAIPLLAAGIFCSQLLSFWMGEDFAIRSYAIVQWLLLGVMINGFAHIPFALLHSAGRADLTAKLHALELLAYLALLVGFVSSYGVLGAALAWTARIMLDTALLYTVAIRTHPAHWGGLLLGASCACLAMLTFLIIVIL